MNSIENLSLILQAISLEILFKDFNNTDLMQELQRQDNEYFDYDGIENALNGKGYWEYFIPSRILVIQMK